MSAETTAEAPPKRSDYLPPLFGMYWLSMQRRARELGYCLALHGSMERDLDAVAIPWTDEAVGAEELFVALAERLGWNPEHVIADPAVKPHGRLAYSLWLFNDAKVKQETGQRAFFLDISILPRAADWSKFR